MILLPILEKFSKEQESCNIPNELIEYSATIAVKFLNYKYQSDRNRFSNLGYLFTDISMDAITPLFVNNQKTNEPGIIKSLKDWLSPIESEAQAQYFLNKIVVNRVEQELIRIYKEADPFFAKIQDSIEFIITKEEYNKQCHFGTIFLHAHKSEDRSRLISQDEFENLPASFFIGKLRSVLLNLFNYITNETEFQTAIPLNALIKRLKHIHLSDEFLTQSIQKENHEERIDVEKIVSESLDSTYNKLECSYNTKLSLPEIEAFKKVLHEMSTDLTNGGISTELYAYLQNHMNGLEKDQFYKKYHSILDYLLRVLKKEITRRLETDSYFSNKR